MPITSKDLNGSAPDKAAAALLLIDVINDFEFENGELLLKLALPVGEQIAKLKAQAKQANLPVIYVNDNFGKWQSDLNKIVSHCLDDGVRGEPFVKLVLPEADDYFVLKPMHSGFYCTSLELLLEDVGSRSLILAGIAGNNCVLFTANDAYMRDFKLFVPADCVASETSEENEYALKQMQKVLKADIRSSGELNLKALAQTSAT
ncbi:MAG TPA: isochorismatase family cysteine hydrolase [Pyrinomonadaceae bacterium]|jgi:nicotinamidase-related amidase|nr:isochorismatase family cysteine hydrolase [Pyrinomonadaceae bacterium]